jgi:hypothetical protein
LTLARWWRSNEVAVPESPLMMNDGEWWRMMMGDDAWGFN